MVDQIQQSAKLDLSFNGRTVSAALGTVQVGCRYTFAMKEKNFLTVHDLN